MAERITVSAKVTGKHYYDAPAFGAPWKNETHYIITFTAEDGKVYVWKTTSFPTVETPYTGRPGCHCFEDRKGNPVEHDSIDKGDEIVFTAGVKGESEYKGVPQTELTRVKIVSRSFRAEREYERKERLEREREARKAALLESITDGDRIIKMDYRQYKEHYADCETVPGSYGEKYDAHGYKYGNPTIDVIVRAGRMKNSGVRGKHFSGYEITFTENGETRRATFRAVCEENAIKRARKAHPNGTGFDCTKVFYYNNYHRTF